MRDGGATPPEAARESLRTDRLRRRRPPRRGESSQRRGPLRQERPLADGESTSSPEKRSTQRLRSKPTAFPGRRGKAEWQGCEGECRLGRVRTAPASPG